jgi:maltooligosyltrehalose trehalohydrolase
MRTDSISWRRLPMGAEPAPGGGVHFRVWAPKRRAVAVTLEPARVDVPLQPEPDGYFSGIVATAAAGTRYRYRLDGGDAFPDPASRFQPDGPHGPSEVVDATRFRWTDEEWRGVPESDRVLYELHVGTFTPEGTWASATRELPALAELGATLLEVLPVNEFPGRFGWGYDGVDLFAPTRLYGEPDDFRRFVDRAHALGMGVVLDVVYNHLGPDGNYLRQFADEYFSTRHTTDWGDALNFDDRGSAAVREFCVANARYWIDEFHLDGLRLDATQNICDASPRHVVRVIAESAHAAAPRRTVFVVAENEPQDANLVRPVADGGMGFDALWNDDWHHSAVVALTGRNEAYYADYRGGAAELVAAVKYGFLFQGQWYTWQKQQRGTSALDLPALRFVHYLENHDQVANSIRGGRLHTLADGGRHRAMTALLLLGPQIPMLFQGQEFASSRPFLYFADHRADLMGEIRKGRASFLAQFQSIAAQRNHATLADPGDPTTFERCKLDHRERERHAEAFALHRDLLALRRSDAVLRPAARARVDGAVLADRAFALRFFGPGGDDRLLLVNLGAPLAFDVVPEPLVAPPSRCGWRVRWTSEAPVYGGSGIPSLPPALHGWCMPGGCAVVLSPRAPNDEDREAPHE